MGKVNKSPEKNERWPLLLACFMAIGWYQAELYRDLEVEELNMKICSLGGKLGGKLDGCFYSEQGVKNGYPIYIPQLKSDRAELKNQDGACIYNHNSR